MINTNPTGRDTTEVAVQRLSQKLITKLNLQNSSRVFEDDSNSISAHDSVPRALSKLNAALTAFDLSNRQDTEPIDSSKSYSEGEIVYAEGASWRVAAGGANAGDLPSTHPDKFVSFQEGVTSIANKEAAYALTGVAAGTVYKTEDTGQILERAAKLDLAADFVIVGNAAGMLGVTLAGTYSADTVGQNSPPSSDVGYLGFYCNENSSGNNMSVTYESGKWIIKGSMQAFESAGGEAHPADVTAWTALSGATGTIDSVTRNEPRNWKHDGTILVYDNDEKQLLTNLPDGQQIEVVGEGGRIERFNGDGDGLNEGDFKILVNHPDNPVISGMRINGIYSYDPSQYYYLNDVGVILGNYGDGTYVFHTSSVEWSAPINGNATPDLMSPWTAQSTAAQGYAAMTSDMITRQPTATESNWFTIKNTVYLTVYDDYYSEGYEVNGVTVADGGTQGVGWVPVGESISQTLDRRYKVIELDGHTVATSVEDHQLQTTPITLIVPDIFPSGALVKVTNNA